MGTVWPTRIDPPNRLAGPARATMIISAPAATAAMHSRPASAAIRSTSGRASSTTFRLASAASPSGMSAGPSEYVFVRWSRRTNPPSSRPMSTDWHVARFISSARASSDTLYDASRFPAR